MEEFDGGYVDDEWVDGGYDWSPVHGWADEWDGSFDVGLNGSTGNSDTTNLFVGLDAKREWGLETTLIDVDYLFSQDRSVVSKATISTTSCPSRGDSERIQ